MNVNDDAIENHPPLTGRQAFTIVCGYLFYIVAGFTVFKAELGVTLAVFGLGFLLTYLPAPRRSTTRLTVKESLVLVAGACIVIATGHFIGERLLRASPLSLFGYLPAWVTLFHGVRDLNRHYFAHHR